MNSLKINKKSPVLLIGGEGLVGKGLKEVFIREFGRDSVKTASLPVDNADLNVDIIKADTVQKLIDDSQPSLVIHLAAATNVNLCEQQPDFANALNVVGTKNVVESAGDVPVVYFSTDFVFDGFTDIPHKENDSPNPQSVYGRTKYQGELALLESNNPGLVLRISFPWYTVSKHLINPALKDSLWWMLQTLMNSTDVPAFENVIGNWTSMSQLQKLFTQALTTCLEKKIKIIHLSGGKPTTPLEVAQEIQRYLGLHKVSNLGKVIPQQFVAETGKTAPRPALGGLDTTLAESLGLGMTSVNQAIARGEWLREENLEIIKKR